MVLFCTSTYGSPGYFGALSLIEVALVTTETERSISPG